MAYTKKTFDETMSDFKKTMQLWRSVKHWEVTRNVKGRNGIYRIILDEDGQSREAIQTWDYSTVGVKLVTRGKDGDVTRELAMRKYGTASDNFRALYNCLEDLRMFEQRGLSELAEQFFRPQLPPPAPARQPESLARTPYGILGVAPDAPMEVIEAAYKAKAKMAHPDFNGGDDTEMKLINLAMEEIRQARGK